MIASFRKSGRAFMGSRPSNASTGRQNDRVAAGAIAFVGRPAVRHVRTRTAGCFEKCVGRLATYGDIAIGRETAPPGVTIARIYSQGGNCHWQPRMDSRLAGGVHLVSRLHDVAHDDGGDVLRLEASALDRRLDSRSAEVSGGYVLERTAERADRRSGRTRGKNI